MISHTTRDFWRRYRSLPPETRKLARKCYLLWRNDARHPSLHFKKIGPRVWSARISDEFRAVATPIQGGFLWYWIGSHEDYEKLIRRLL